MRPDPLHVERCRSGPELDERFPTLERLYAYEGGVLFGTQRPDGYWLISESQLDQDPDNVTIYHFPDFAAAEAWHDSPRSHAFGPLKERIRRDQAR